MPKDELPISIEIPAGTPIRIRGASLEKSASVMEKQAGNGSTVIEKGHKYTVHGTLDTDVGSEKVSLVIIRGV